MPEKEKYTADDIQVLEGLEGVRRRPAMYIGDTGKRGVHHLLYEVLDNSIDEALANYCHSIGILLRKDGGVTIADDGRGIPTEMHPSGKSAMEVVATMLHAGGKFEKKAYQVSGGLHGVGLSVVNALSESMDVEVHRNGKVHVQSHERGKPKTKVIIAGDTPKHGTVVRFKPDPKIFKDTTFDYDYLKERIMELAFLNKGLKIVLADERTGKKESFHYEGGIVEYAEYLNKARPQKLNSPPAYFHRKEGNVDVECSFQYTDSYNALLFSFVNGIKTIEGGTHLVGFRMAVTRALNDYLRINKFIKNGKKMSSDDVVEGMTAIISVKIPEPQFEGQTKTKLGNSEVKGAVSSISYDAIKAYLEENPDAGKNIAAKIMRSMEAREAAQKAKDLIRRKSVFESSILPGKLADCSEKDPAKCELYLVEGDSAGGSSKQGRDREFQAILPLKGKILNVEKAPIHKVLTSNEIKSIVLSIGAGFGDDFDLPKTRYHKVIIMTDADVDGSHIRTLLLTLFYRYFKPLIEKGYIYIAQPPLYKIKKGKTMRYAYNDEELKKVSEELGGKVDLQRYKGLGEMNPIQLWDTTMDPSKRTLKRVTIEDAMKADELFTILMGSEVEPRKKFIEDYAKEVKNLDV